MGCCNSREEEKKSAKTPRTSNRFLKRKQNLKRFNSQDPTSARDTTPQSINGEKSPRSHRHSSSQIVFDQSPSAQSESSSLHKSFTESTIQYTKSALAALSRKNTQTLKVLSRNDYESVKLICARGSDIKRVLKKIDLSRVKYLEEDLEKLKKIKELCHPSIVKTEELIKTANTIYIVSEFLEGGSLFEKILKGNMSEEMACVYTNSILSALSCCHHQNIVHGNLKPSKILFKSRFDHTSAKLISFGLSWNKIKLSSSLSDLHFAAPEVLKGANENEKSDIWSLGVILHMLLLGRPPFHGEDEEILIKKIEYGFTLDKNLFLYYSSEVKDLLEKMLKSDPNKRISADQALDHSWFSRAIMKQKSFLRFLYFHTKNKIEKSILISIASHKNLSEEKELKNIFDILDVDHSQSINIEECYTNHSLFGFANHNEIKEIVEKHNIDDKYHFDFTQFVAAFTDWNAQDQAEKINNWLAPYANSEGYLNIEKLKKFLPEFNNEEWQEFFGIAGIKNEDKKIRIQKFAQFLSREKSQDIPNINIIMVNE